jgi:hypothetical protein
MALRKIQFYAIYYEIGQETGLKSIPYQGILENLAKVKVLSHDATERHTTSIYVLWLKLIICCKALYSQDCHATNHPYNQGDECNMIMKSIKSVQCC